jgi:type IV pilus assembly protein PilV
MAMTQRRKQNPMANQQGGMTLIELMIAMVVLAIGVLGSMSLIIRAIGGDSWSKQLSNSTVLAQTVTERMMAIPAQFNATVTITDCANVVSNVNTAPGGSALNSDGEIDYTAGAVAAYQMFYTDCDTNGRQTVYDVRWNVQAIANSGGYTKILTVSAKMRNAGNNAMVFAPESTVRTIIGQGT